MLICDSIQPYHDSYVASGLEICKKNGFLSCDTVIVGIFIKVLIVTPFLTLCAILDLCVWSFKAITCKLDPNRSCGNLLLDPLSSLAFPMIMLGYALANRLPPASRGINDSGRDEVTSQEGSALEHAARWKDAAKVKELLVRGARLDVGAGNPFKCASDVTGNNATLLALCEGNPAHLKEIVNSEKYEDSNPPLYWVAHLTENHQVSDEVLQQRQEMVKMVLAAGADPNYIIKSGRLGEHGKTVFACFARQRDHLLIDLKSLRGSSERKSLLEKLVKYYEEIIIIALQYAPDLTVNAWHGLANLYDDLLKGEYPPSKELREKLLQMPLPPTV